MGVVRESMGRGGSGCSGGIHDKCKGLMSVGFP